MSATTALVGEHCDGYSLQPGLIDGVLCAATGVDLECKQFTSNVDHILVPQVVGRDIHDLRPFGVLNEAACLRHSLQLADEILGLLR